MAGVLAAGAIGAQLGAQLGPAEGAGRQAAVALGAGGLQLAVCVAWLTRRRRPDWWAAGGAGAGGSIGAGQVGAAGGPAAQLAPVAGRVFAGLGVLLLAWPWVQLASFAGAAVQRVTGGPQIPELGHATLGILAREGATPAAVALAAAAVLVAPVVEECLYRGLMQGAFGAIGARPFTRTLLVAAIFSLVHVGAVPSDALAAALPALAVLGIALGVARERSGTLLVPMVAHAAFNGANLLILLWRPSPILPAS